MAGELPPPPVDAADDAGAPPSLTRRADWTLVQLSGRSRLYRGAHFWRGQWVALNQRGEIYQCGEWADCWESAKYWVRHQPPRGAAEGEAGIGSRRPLPGFDDDTDGR